MSNGNGCSSLTNPRVQDTEDYSILSTDSKFQVMEIIYGRCMQRFPGKSIYQALHESYISLFVYFKIVDQNGI